MYKGSLLSADTERLAADLERLATYTLPNEAGWSRPLFSEPYTDSRRWVAARMTDAGLETHVDRAGNIVGRLPGRVLGPPLVTGSHTDTVLGGGRFDGVVGVLGGIEVARLLRESGHTLQHDLLVVDFLGEESNPYGYSCLGSRAAVGELHSGDLDRRNAEGETLGQAIRSVGLDPDGFARPGWAADPIHAYVELHVEQGPTLERAGKEIGVVTAIAGIERLLAAFTGRADHAGTRPMGDRRDALVAAAKAVLTVEREGCGAPVHAVATTGNLHVSPGSVNVVPDEVKLWAEFRSTDAQWLSGVRGRVTAEIARLAAESGVDEILDWVIDNTITPTHPSLQEEIGHVAENLGHAWMPVPSGATHDAAHLARRCRTGMIFIPSKDGRSHCPEEWTDIDDIARGTNVLAETLCRLDASNLDRQ